MKEYKKNIELENPGKAMPPLNFTIETRELALDDEAVLVFDNTGKFLGHVTEEVSRKYLYGWLYYATKRAYQIRTVLSEDGDRHEKHVIHKKNGNTCLVFTSVYIEEKDLIDKNNKADLLQRTIQEIKNIKLKDWDIDLPDYSYEDEFNLGLEKMTKHHEKEVRALMKKQQDELIQKLTDRMVAESELKKEANAMGLPVEF